MKALIVESDLMSQCVLARLLGERGHETVCFENAEQAILAYKKEFYPLVFVAEDLPGMDGIQFCRWLRAQEGGGKSYVMLAYAASVKREVHSILGVGANDFLPKPFDVVAAKLRLDVGERFMGAFFHEQELEELMQRHGQEMDAMHGELSRAGDAVIREQEARQELERKLEALRVEAEQEKADYDRKLKEQAEELCSAADRLQSVTSFRSKVEDDLRKVRQELESQAGKHARQLEGVRSELGLERDRLREAESKYRAELEEARVKLREVGQAMAKANERRQVVESEARRAAESFAGEREELQRRQADLVEELRVLKREGASGGAVGVEEHEKVLAKCVELEAGVGAMREEFERKAAASREELLRLDRELGQSLGARRALDAELLEVRGQVARQAEEYAASMLGVGRQVEELVRKRAESLEEVQSQQIELQELRKQVLQVSFEKSELEQELQKAWTELEGGKRVEGEVADVELSEVRQALEERSARCVELERQLQTERLRVQDRLRRFAATLETVEQGEQG
ncbi:MAG: hypothetical protein RI897_3132 [Verrucomicrobiota bacterium]|jgi:DNA-binding response OmpR family regulator